MYSLASPVSRFAPPESIDKGVKSLLRVLSGPNVGATVMLPNGAFMVGRDVNCDIVLRDEFVAAEHLRILQVNQRLKLEILARPVWVNGVEHQGGSLTLKHHDVVSVGLSAFCLGSPGEPWPGVQLPDIGAVEKPQAAEPTLYEGDGVQAASTTVVPVAPATKNRAGRTVKARQQGWRRWHPGLTVPLLLMLAAFWLGARPPPESSSRLTGEAEIRALEDAVNQVNAVDSIDIRRSVGGNLVINGHVGDYLEKQVLTDRIRRISPDADIRIFDGEQVLAQVLRLVSEARLTNVKAESVSPGVIALLGYEKDDFALRSMLQHISREVSGLRELRDEVVTPDAAFRVLLDDVTAAQLDNRLLLSMRGERILAEGRLSPEWLQQWQRVKHKFLAVYEALPELVDRVTAKVEEPD